MDIYRNGTFLAGATAPVVGDNALGGDIVPEVGAGFKMIALTGQSVLAVAGDAIEIRRSTTGAAGVFTVVYNLILLTANIITFLNESRGIFGEDNRQDQLTPTDLVYRAFLVSTGIVNFAQVSLVLRTEK